MINPTGVNNKYDLISMLRPGIYALSETHLSKVGLQRFRAALRRSTTFKFVPGAPVAGVGFLSSFPTRTVAQDWDGALFESGRIAASSFFIEPTRVLGYATGKERTADLARAGFGWALAQPAGPRFISGDFNLGLPHLDVLRQHGFRDIQEVAQIKFGRAPASTCKQASRKDFMFLGPELQSALLEVDVVLDYFPEHGILNGKFALSQADCAALTWRAPQHRRGLYGKTVLPTQQSAPAIQDSSSEQYRDLWQRYEERLSNALQQNNHPPLSASETGRAGTSEVAVR